MVDVELLAPLVAVMIASPSAIAVTNPVGLTVAVCGRLLVQSIGAFVRTPPPLALSAYAVAVSCTARFADPFRKIVADEGVTTTRATDCITGEDTRIVAEPATPSAVAVMVLEPAATAVTRPEVDTAATLGVPELHDTARPVTTAPFTSRTVATKSTAPPMATVALPGATVTVPIATGDTVTAAAPDFPSIVAVMVLEPAETAASRPVLDTVATAGALDDQSTTRPRTVLPLTSRTVATKSVAPPTVSEVEAGVTLTVAIGGGFTVTVADPIRPSA